MQIFLFLGSKIENIKSLDELLEKLVEEDKIEQKDDFFSIKNIEQFVSYRLEGELRYRQLQDRVEKSTKRLSYFPFVKFVGLSGSMSKGFASDNADIDLFIVTKKNRLWICRTILHLFKKISFLKGSQHWYCMNYFVDETAMQIEEQNYFTAIELTTLKPLVDAENYHQLLIEKNIKWINSVLPNYHFKHTITKQKLNQTFLSRLIEQFSTDKLDNWLMKWTDKKWRKKWARKNYPHEDYELAFKTRKNISKNHLHNYQKKLLEHLDKIKKVV